ARTQMEEEARRVRDRVADLAKRVEQLDADILREEQIIRDNSGALEKLDEEEASLSEAEAGAEGREAELKAAVEVADAELAEKEAVLTELTSRKAEAAATRTQAERAV